MGGKDLTYNGFYTLLVVLKFMPSPPSASFVIENYTYLENVPTDLTCLNNLSWLQ